MPTAEITDHNVFQISGFVGEVPQPGHNLFLNFVVARNAEHALGLQMDELPGFSPIGIVSLAQLKHQVAALEQVKTRSSPALLDENYRPEEPFFQE